jgi:PBSX family phage terminase large subunit
MDNLLSKKQLEFIVNSNAKWNLAHGSVRSGKTFCTLLRFMQAAHQCPDTQIYMVGYSSDTIYKNAIRLLFESDEFAIFRPFITWTGGTKRELKFRDKTICTLGAQNEGAIGSFQGKTFSLVYCDEMTLYPDSIIDMIDSRLSNPHSMGFASMNPKQPTHKIKGWIDEAAKGNKDYYALHFTLDDNPYVPEEYKERIRKSGSGIFYKRNYLGLWCLAEGSIFDFFDRDVYVVRRPPAAADYWVAAIDFGMSNPSCCLLVGVSTGQHNQLGKKMWVEKEYYYDPKQTERQKIVSEIAQEIQEFLSPYAIKNIYVDPSATAIKTEMRRMGMHIVDANNDVEEGIHRMTSEMKIGNLFICAECKNTIKEIESYVWDPKAAKDGYDEPLKQNDHSVDCLRYIINTHKVAVYDPYQHNPKQYQQNRFRSQF